MRRWKALVRRALRIGAWSVALAVGVLRVLPGVGASPAPIASPEPGSGAFRMVTYNILGTDPAPMDRLIAALKARAPAVVGLVEVPGSKAEALAADEGLARLYPWQELRPYAPHGGIAILSSYPMEAAPNDPSIPVLRATVDIDGTQVSVIEAHASNPLTSGGRDSELGRIRALIERQAAAGMPVVMAGDLNTNAFEPAFWSLSSGLHDVDAGATWGPDPNGPALLRIDHILTTPDLVPRDGAVDCDASGSDHCLLEAVIGLPAGSAVPASPAAEAGS
ncbi:MAG: endonuclease/exonuclease/phosphatase family protein [Chloroflexota bacterium]